MKNKDEVLLKPSEAAVIIGVDPKTITRWAAAGKLACTRTIGGHRRYKPEDIYALRDGTALNTKGEE